MKKSKIIHFISGTVFFLFLVVICATAYAEEETPASLEIRGPVYAGWELESILAVEGIQISASNFPAFYYDVDDDVATETLLITEASGNTILEGGLVYSTSVVLKDFAYEGASWAEGYPVVGLFGEPFVPLDQFSADKLAPLLLDDDEKYILRGGEILDLGEGYAIEAKQIDVNSNKVWLEFTRDGEYMDDEIISVDVGETGDWAVDLDGIEGENDVIVLRVHVNQVFQGAVDSIAQIEGLWLIDYENAFTVANDEVFGCLEVTCMGDTLEFQNDNDVTLPMDSYVEIAEGMKFKVADSYDELRFCVVKEISEPGTYEVRGSVVQNTTNFVWDSLNFPAFYYGMDDNTCAETLIFNGTSNGTIIEVPERGLEYTTRIMIKEFDYYFSDWHTVYPILPLYGNVYVPLASDRANKLAELLLDNDDRCTLYLNESLELGSGYALKLKQIDESGNKVVLEFSKDGYPVTSQALDLSVGDPFYATWNLYVDGIEGEDDILVFKVHVNQVFDAGENSFIEIEGLWLIDYANAFTIGSGEKFGTLEARVLGSELAFSNYESILLEPGSILKITEDIKFKVADTEAGEPVRFYPFVEITVGTENLLIREFSPADSALKSVENETKEFSIVSSVPCDIIWSVDGSAVKTETSVESSAYTASLPCGVHEISVRAENETVVEKICWEWTVVEEEVPSSESSFKIRGPVYNGTSLEDILGTNGGEIVIDATSFAGFYYDIDEDIATEMLTIRGYCYGRTIDDGSLIYSTTIACRDYEYGSWYEQYPILSLFGEPYIPLTVSNPDKLARLLNDSDDIYTLKINEVLDLGSGYALKFKQIDETGTKVLLEFTKNGELVDDEILDVSAYMPDEAKTWTIDLDDIEGEDDIVVFKAHINQAFKDGENSFIKVEGLWLIDYANAFTIRNDDVFGALELCSISGNSLVFANDDSVTLEMDSTVEIANGLEFVIADSEELRFYLAKECTEPGTYEVRGEFNTAASPFAWDFANFPGFFYELDENLCTEHMEITGMSDRTIPEGALAYTTVIQAVDFEYDDWNYYDNGVEWQYTGGYTIEALFGEIFVPLNGDRADKLAPLVCDSDDKYTLKLGNSLDLGSGYSLELTHVGVGGDQVSLAMIKDGETVSNGTVNASSEGYSTWNLDLDNIQEENDVTVLKAHVENAFIDGDNSFVVIEGIWLIDYYEAFTIQDEEAFGSLEANVLGSELELLNGEALTLYSGSTPEIGGGMNFRVADSPELRFYPFVEVVIENDNSSSGGGSGSGGWISWDDPESDGGTWITTAELQQIIYYWLNDLPVHPEN